MNVKLKYHFIFWVFILNTLSVLAIGFQKKQVDSLLEVANNNAFKNPDKTIEISLSIYNDESNSLENRIRALMRVSLGYNSKRDYKKALDYIIKANELSNLIVDEKLKIEILFSIGVQYQHLKIYDKAIEALAEIETIALKYPERDSISNVLASSYIVKGFIYKDNLNCDIALEYFNKGLKEFERLGNNSHNRSIGYYNKGNCYIMLSDIKNAKESFNKSLEFANEVNAVSLVSFAEKGMAEVYTYEGKYEDATLLLNSALDKSKDVGDLVLNLGIYEGLFENYLALDQWENYQKYYGLFLKTQLVIKISERTSVSVSINESSKNLNVELNQVHSKFKNKFISIILVIVIFIAMVFFLEIKNDKIIKELQKKIENSQNIKPFIKNK